MCSLYKKEEKELHQPDIARLCQVLTDGLKKNFEEASVSEVDCPNLSQSPWCLAAEGICGSPKLLGVGGVPYLIPSPQKDKKYNFDDLANCIGEKDCVFLGAGAAAAHLLGHNAEMMANLRVGSQENVQTRIAKVGDKGECVLKTFKEKEFCLLGDLLACKGNRGKVIRVHAKTRTGEENFIHCIRNVLKQHYPSDTVGIGGVFLIKTGKAKLHVMPDYSKTPLVTDKDVENWLNFYEFSAPLVCLSVFYNHEKDLDLRIEHTHCFSDHGEGGHYHHDTTPTLVEYEGYFVVAEKVIRIDRPTSTHLIGRD